MATYDVIVVGGRVAGSALAIMLGRLGARVLVLERDIFPSAPVSVPVIFANALTILDRLGVRPAIEAAGAAKIRVGGLRSGDIDIRMPIPAYNNIDYHLGVRREILDTIMIDRVTDEPTVEVRTGYVVTHILREGDTVIGVRGHSKGGLEEDLHAPVVAGADGRLSLVARTVQPKLYRVKPGQNCMYYAYYRNFRRHSEPIGYTYWAAGYTVSTFDADNGLTAISVSSRVDDWPLLKKDVTGEFEKRWRAIAELNEFGRNAERVGMVKGFGPRDSFYRTPFGPGWVLVGDAGYYKDPCTGQGIYDALRSAELVTAAWLDWQQGIPWEQAMYRYQSIRDRETRHIYRLTYHLSKTHRYARQNLAQRLWWRLLPRRTVFLSQLIGACNGAFSPGLLINVPTPIRLMQFAGRIARLRSIFQWKI